MRAYHIMFHEFLSVQRKTYASHLLRQVHPSQRQRDTPFSCLQASSVTVHCSCSTTHSSLNIKQIRQVLGCYQKSHSFRQFLFLLQLFPAFPSNNSVFPTNRAFCKGKALLVTHLLVAQEKWVCLWRASQPFQNSICPYPLPGQAAHLSLLRISNK